VKHFLLNIVGVCVVVGLVFSSCKVREVEELDARLKMKLDPSLSEDERNLLREDAQFLLSRSMTAPSGSLFDQIFGGQSTQFVGYYLDERVNYFLSKSVRFQSRVSTDYIKDFLTFNQVYTVASNIGTAIWLVSEAAEQNLIFTLGDIKIPVLSTRVGIVQLGKGYTVKNINGKPVDSVVRSNTLVHEARHSDCTGGLKETDKARLKQGQIPVGKECGHIHVVCPAGHDLAGFPGCDSHAWGAYSVDAVYASAIATLCQNCSELQKQVALASAAESFSRVLVLEDMIAGRLGRPDMTSWGDHPFSTDPLNSFRTERLNFAEEFGIESALESVLAVDTDVE
jgi:hypothetical protein